MDRLLIPMIAGDPYKIPPGLMPVGYRPALGAPGAPGAGNLVQAAHHPGIEGARILRVQSTNPCATDPDTGQPFDPDACQTQQAFQGNTASTFAGGVGGAWGIGGTILCAIEEPCGILEQSVIAIGGLIALGGWFGNVLYGGSGGYSLVTS